tara:strand:- start:143 stop:664 length:522 start_codon:yes stop_codon:yes gene_type:complete
MENKSAELIALFVIDFIKAEFVAQGHSNTGKLEDSLTWKLEGDKINIYGVNYAKWVDSGRQKEATPIPIDALAKWVEQRGIASGDDEIMKVAYAIQAKIFKEGSPTVNSFKFSKNGRRDKFITFAISENEKAIFNKIYEVFGGFLKGQFQNMMEDAKSKYWSDKEARKKKSKK